MSERSLTRRERELMDLIHVQPGLSVATINEQLGSSASYSSTRAALARLVEKGHLRHAREGARYLYFPVVEQGTAGRSAMRRVIDTFFAGSAPAAMDALLALSGDNLADKDYQELLRAIEDFRDRAEDD